MSCKFKMSGYGFSIYIAAALLSFSASTVLADPGDLDVSFGTGGQVYTIPADSTAGSAKAVAVQPDGKIVAAGYSWHDDANNSLDRYDFLVARYLANGDPDPTFGTDGVVLTKVSPALLAFDHADEIIIQPDGKILILGFSRAGSFDEIALIRYEADGNLDETFGDLEYVSGGEGTPVIYKGKGYIRLDAFNADGITNNRSISNGFGMALQPDGMILVTGYARTSLDRRIVVARYDRDGQLDTSFDTNGTGNTGIRVWGLNPLASNSSDEGRAIAVQPDGKIVVAGFTTSDVPGSASCCNESPFLVRLIADGSYDPSEEFFQAGTDGIAQIVSVDNHDIVTDLVIQSDGKLLVVGYTEATFGSSIKDIILVRWNADGSLDTDFGTNGTVRKTTVSEKEWGYALVVQPNGKILVAGRTANSGLVLRYNIDGSIDSNFGSAGQVVIPTLGQADGIALQPNGDILIVGPGYGAGLRTSGSMSVVRLKGTPVDLLPAAFAFTDQTDVATSAEVLSDMVTVVGFNVGNSVPVRVTGGELAVNGVYQTFGYVKNLDEINVRHTSAATDSTVTETTVTAGGLHAPDNIALVLGATHSDTFSSTTSGNNPPPPPPDPCPFDASLTIDDPACVEPPPPGPDPVIDADGDGIPDDMDNAPDVFNPDQSDIDNDMVADVSDPCPNDAEDACDPDASAAESVGPAGGSLATADGSVVIDVPAQALNADTSLSITDLGTDITLAAELNDVLVVMAIDVGPDGTSFNIPVTLTFTWTDADNDGVVDGTSIDENALRISQDSAFITGVCGEEAACDVVNNTFSVDIDHLSVYALSAAADAADAGGNPGTIPVIDGGSSSATGPLELMLLLGFGLLGRARARFRSRHA